MNHETLLWMHLTLRAKLRLFRNERIKFKSCLEINNNNNKNNTASYNKKLDCLHSYYYTLLISKRLLKWLAVSLFVISPLNPCELFEFPIDVTRQPLGHSKYNTICDMDTYNKQTRESTNF